MRIDYVSGVEGNSIYADDYRIAGPKPWGGGYVICTFMTSKDELLKKFESDTAVFEVFDYSLFINEKYFLGSSTQEAYEENIKKIDDRRKRFEKDNKHNHNWKLCYRHKWVVKKEDILYAYELHQGV